MRTLNEIEIRGTGALLLSTVQFARKTLALWGLRKNRPTKDEMHDLCVRLMIVEDNVIRMSKGPESVGNIEELDSRIRKIQNEILSLNNTIRSV